MRFFKRSRADSATIPEDLQPYYSPQNSGWRRWIAPILRIVLLLVVLALLVWGGVWLVHKFTNKDTNTNNGGQVSTQDGASSTTKKQSSSTSTPKQPATQGTTGGTPKSTSGTSPTPNPSTPSPSATTPDTSTPAAPATTPSAPAGGGTSPLVNTGPGETLAIFAVVTAAAAIAHRMFTLRKLSK